MPVTVVVTTWQVPFAQVVKEIKTFDQDAEALAFINAEGKKWWDENDGDRWVEESNVASSAGKSDGSDKPWEPINELGYDWGKWEIWDGEAGFHAMLDEASETRLHEEHYKREYDDKGRSRPGYLRNAYGEDTSQEIAEVQAYYSGQRH